MCVHRWTCSDGSTGPGRKTKGHARTNESTERQAGIDRRTRCTDRQRIQADRLATDRQTGTQYLEADKRIRQIDNSSRQDQQAEVRQTSGKDRETGRQKDRQADRHYRQMGA